MATDPFKSAQASLDSPATTLAPVTASDGVDLPGGVCRALLVGSGGLATVIDASGAERVGVPLQSGYNPIRVGRVKATGLAASNIWALY